MAGQGHGTGGSLEEALRAGLADLAETETEKIELTLHVPGFELATGSAVHASLEVESPTPARDESETPVTASDQTPTQDRDADERAPGADEPTTTAASTEDAPDVAPETESAPASDDERGTDEEGDDGDSGDEGAPLTPEDLDAEADRAADFLEGMLDILDLPGDLQIRTHEDHAEVEITEVGSGALIGRRGQTLEAVQELVRCVLQREFERRARVKVDVEGYRARRLERLLEKAREGIEQVQDGGEPVRLEPMDVFERKEVHHLVAEHEGVTSRSQGREPGRRVIIEGE